MGMDSAVQLFCKTTALLRNEVSPQALTCFMQTCKELPVTLSAANGPWQNASHDQSSTAGWLPFPSGSLTAVSPLAHACSLGAILAACRDHSISMQGCKVGIVLWELPALGLCVVVTCVGDLQNWW